MYVYDSSIQKTDTYTCMHVQAHTHARTHARTHACTHTHTLHIKIKWKTVMNMDEAIKSVCVCVCACACVCVCVCSLWERSSRSYRWTPCSCCTTRLHCPPCCWSSSFPSLSHLMPTMACSTAGPLRPWWESLWVLVTWTLWPVDRNTWLVKSEWSVWMLCSWLSWNHQLCSPLMIMN